MTTKKLKIQAIMYLGDIGIVDVQLTMYQKMAKSKMYGLNSGKIFKKMIELKKEKLLLLGHLH